jgi:proline iminopeptidase
LILRAVFLVRQKDVDWFTKDGAGRIYPEQWQKLVESIPEPHRDNLLDGLCAALWGADEVARRRVTKAWQAWGGQVALGNAYLAASDDDITEKRVKQVAMELHYAKHRYFIAENQILDNCHKLQDIPTRIIHGRMDLMCPIEAGDTLHHALPHADYVILPNAGHIAGQTDMIDALVCATDEFAAQ